MTPHPPRRRRRLAPSPKQGGGGGPGEGKKDDCRRLLARPSRDRKAARSTGGGARDDGRAGVADRPAVSIAKGAERGRATRPSKCRARAVGCAARTRALFRRESARRSTTVRDRLEPGSGASEKAREAGPEEIPGIGPKAQNAPCCITWDPQGDRARLGSYALPGCRASTRRGSERFTTSSRGRAITMARPCVSTVTNASTGVCPT